MASSLCEEIKRKLGCGKGCGHHTQISAASITDVISGELEGIVVWPYLLQAMIELIRGVATTVTCISVAYIDHISGGNLLPKAKVDLFIVLYS